MDLPPQDMSSSRRAPSPRSSPARLVVYPSTLLRSPFTSPRQAHYGPSHVPLRSPRISRSARYSPYQLPHDSPPPCRMMKRVVFALPDGSAAMDVNYAGHYEDDQWAHTEEGQHYLPASSSNQDREETSFEELPEIPVKRKLKPELSHLIGASSRGVQYVRGAGLPDLSGAGPVRPPISPFGMSGLRGQPSARPPP